MTVLRLALSLCLARLCAADWNNEKFQNRCNPAACSVEGVCYCSDKKDGWFDGGSGYSADMRSKQQSLCYKAGVGDCECADCGYLVFPNVQCQDLRCNDDTDIAVTGVRSADSDKKCYRMDPVKGKVYTDRKWYFNCYSQYNECDSSKCGYGERLTGCMRINPGTCQPCGSLPSGSYWTTRGGCSTALCDLVLPGFYMTAPCGNTTNTAKVPCSEHQGNPNAAAFPNPVKQYYCPGGIQAPVHVPSFGIVNADYTDFNCVSGYFRVDTECRACLPGSACLHDKSFICKADYYSDKYAQSECKRCTSTCTYETELPMRCQQGSIQNSRCVTCGACGLWPTTGVNCVKDPVEFRKLPETCVPADVQSDVTVC